MSTKHREPPFQYILTKRHGARCCSIDEVRSGELLTPWGGAVGLVFRDIFGRSQTGGTTLWLCITCNSPGCSAEVLIRFNDLLKLLPVGEHK